MHSTHALSFLLSGAVRGGLLVGGVLAAALPAQNARLLLDMDPAGSGMFAHRHFHEAFWDVYGETWFASARPTPALWKSDGTARGTVAVTATGSLFGGPLEHVLPGLSRVFFVGIDARGMELWSSDGTPAGTGIVRDIYPGSVFGYGRTVVDAAELRGTLFFGGNGPISGLELWKTDGTTLGTVLVKDIFPGAQDGGPSGFLRVGPFVYFLARAVGGTYSFDLWRTDGTATGTIRIAQIGAMRFSSLPVPLPNQRFAFVTASNGHDFWVSDGTAAGTTLVRQFSLATRTLIVGTNSKGAFLFVEMDILGSECWFSDGTSAGTSRIFKSPSIASFYPWAEGRVMHDKLYCRFETPAFGKELWVSDGTALGTTIVRDIRPGTQSSDPYSFVATERYVYFIADAGAGYRVFRTDGTAGGTVQVGGSTEPVGRLTLSGGKLYFIGNDPVVGMEPFVMDLPANSKRFGNGCAASRWPSELSATDPVLGGLSTIRLERGPASRVGVIAFGFRADMRNTMLGSDGCALYLDWSQPVVGMFIVTDGNGRASIGVRVPSTAGLAGTRIVAQALIGPTAQAPLGLDVSPGLLLTLGN